MLFEIEVFIKRYSEIKNWGGWCDTLTQDMCRGENPCTTLDCREREEREQQQVHCVHEEFLPALVTQPTVCTAGQGQHNWFYLFGSQVDV